MLQQRCEYQILLEGPDPEGTDLKLISCHL